MKVYVSGIIDGYDEGILSMLDAHRRKKAEQIKPELERYRSISAGLLLRYAYIKEDKSGVLWDNVVIDTGEYGKPYIRGNDNFKYSLSHSGDYVICAVDSDEIGADIQENKDYKESVAKRFFHESEYERIKKAPQNEKKEEFYKIWTAKESAVKYSARGMGEGIEHLVTSDSYDTINNLRNGESLRLKIYDEIKGYTVCICSKGNNFPKSLSKEEVCYVKNIG